jgi:hypothetical protein
MSKKYTNSLLSLKAKVRKSLERDNDDNNHYDDGIEYLGVTTDIFRQMTAVEAEPMIVGHNYPSKEILLMRIAEEANLHNVEAATIWSCDKRVYFQGTAGATFTVKARHSETKNWTVKEYVHWTVPALPRMDNLDEVNIGNDDGENNEEKDNDDDEEKDDNEDFYSDDPDDFEDGDDDGEDGDDIIGDEGDGDGIPKANKRRKRTTTPKRRSPIKSRWLVSLIKQRIAECPNISNKECAHLLRLHIRFDFLTKGKLGKMYSLYSDTT